ncbi:protein NDNF [Girardinichthys multiradiatus]|uniref:protein NDNF n=1 Tax=Girardinichthys multiradiatus TaxID=208333 RepID=UPI001FAB9537|nr:protein NDNF [Girardinichthys multiradiatus]XP_047206698.1 protein NDNF [Girardinichthys multiradiatus]XP_047206699.1 protein NDNF [Girardinichthys multiradiatus]XP_047206700.1 protein NDNF [Girardinichthys multiradiatus]
MALSWCLCATVMLVWGSLLPQVHSVLALENEVPLRPATWLPEGKITSVTLPKGRTRRLYFTLKKKTSAMLVTVSPCTLPIEWSLAARTLKDKPLKNLQWITKKSTPEVWWRGPGTEEKIHSFTGDTADTYNGPPHPHASVYILRLRSKQQTSRATVFLHEGPGPLGIFPLMPADPQVQTLGVGMTSVTLSWVPSASITSLPKAKNSYDYCVLINSLQNYPSLCAAKERKQREKDQNQGKKEKKRQATPWPILKDWWWEQWDSYPEIPSLPSSLGEDFNDLQCACQGTENVCTVSELLPDTSYYFDVFVIDKVNRTSAAYKGAFARTHEEARAAVVPLREGELRWVSFQDSGSNSQQLFSFHPRGWKQSGLLTLQSCGGGEKIKVTVSSKGQVLNSQGVGTDLIHIWLQGSPSYLIHFQQEGTTTSQVSSLTDAARLESLKASVKMQVSSAFHRRGVPSLPSTLQIKSFNRLRGCNSVTLAWMGTEERSLYCVYRRKLSSFDEEAGGASALNAPCLGPESRSDTERVLCKYFQELNPRRAVTTAVIGGLEPGMAYVFDVYLMRRWGIPIKYVSKMLKTRKEC